MGCNNRINEYKIKECKIKKTENIKVLFDNKEFYPREYSITQDKRENINELILRHPINRIELILNNSELRKFSKYIDNIAIILILYKLKHSKNTRKQRQKQLISYCHLSGTSLRQINKIKNSVIIDPINYYNEFFKVDDNLVRIIGLEPLNYIDKVMEYKITGEFMLNYFSA
jgi:hypothetical protein